MHSDSVNYGPILALLVACSHGQVKYIICFTPCQRLPVGVGVRDEVMEAMYSSWLRVPTEYFPYELDVL